MAKSFSADTAGNSWQIKLEVEVRVAKAGLLRTWTRIQSPLPSKLFSEVSLMRK